jgi:predicted porin
MDSGVEHLNNIDTGGGTRGSLTRMPSITGTMSSRFGVNVAKEVQPGYKAIATAELGFNMDDGTLGQGGRGFGRQVFVGLDTPYGAVTFGRQWSMMFYAMLGSDLIGPNLYSMGSLDPYLPNMRFDNSIAWRGKFSNFSVGALYSTGRSVVANGGAPATGNCAGEIANSKACRGMSLMAKYDDTNWGIAGAIDEQHGGVGSTGSTDQVLFYNGTAPIAFIRPEDKDRRNTVGGYYKFGQVKLGLGWLGRKVEAESGTTRSAIYYVGGAYTLDEKITLDAGWNRIKNTDQDRRATLVVVRGFYNFDKSLAAYLQLGHIANSAKAVYALSVGAGVSPPAGGGQMGTFVGLRYKF